MYNPERFKSTDVREAFELMNANPFATVITVHDNQPVISHLPITAKLIGEKVELIGHLARANPHSKLLAAHSVTTIFQGGHTYITPQWYKDHDVPTWNYSAVHVRGSVELIETADGIVQCLRELADHAESLWPSGWEFFVPEDLAGDILPKKIVGFKIHVADINFKKKLNQGRSPADQAGVLEGLRSRGDDESRKVLHDMLKLYGDDFQRA